MKKRLLGYSISSLICLICLSGSFNVQAQTVESVDIVAGSTPGNAGNDGPALFAQLDAPQDVVVAPDGTFYITDYANHDVRKVEGGTISLVAGNGTADFVGIPGPLANAVINTPQGITMDSQGNLYFGIFTNNSVLKIDFAKDSIFIAAGHNGAASSGDGGPATAAAVLQPWGVQTGGRLSTVSLMMKWAG